MTVNIRHRNERKTALPRTGKVLDAVGGGVSSSGGSYASGGGNTPPVEVNVDITHGEGIAVKKDQAGDTLLYTISHGDTSDMVSSTNIDDVFVQNIEVDDFGHILSVENVRLAASLDNRYLRKDIDDTAHGIISFDKKIGSSIYIDDWEGKGWEILPEGVTTFDSTRIRNDLYVGNKIGSPTFASGFTGWGVEIDIPTATAEMDNLFVRKTFTAYEIVYSQIYGLGGSQIVSDLNKIASVEVMPDRYRCYMDDMDGLMLMNFRKGDGVRIQTRTGTTSIKYLMGRCIGVDSDYFDIAIPLLEGTGQPEAGDFAMRWGNNEDVNRQGLIYLTTADRGAPFIDVYDGITEATTEGKLKARLGNLKGIRTMNNDQLTGYGAYLSGVYIENSTFYTDTGETVDQRFVAMNGKFNSTIEGLRDDMSSQSGNILRNSSFSRDTNYWTTANTVHFIDVAGEYLWMDGSFYTEKAAVADIYNDSGRNVLRIRNTEISQLNELMNIQPRSEVSEEGYAYSFALFAKVLRAGSLSAGIPGTPLFLEQQLEPSGSYEKISKFGKWDEKGNFQIKFTGEILIYGVSLFNDALADAQIKLQTQIDQTNAQILLLATKEYVDDETGQIYTHYDSRLQITAEQMSGISTKVDNINDTIETSGWITRAEGTSIFAKKEMESGKSIVNAINVGTEGILISGNRINLNGVVSFNMLSDYSTINNRINGKADSSSLGDLAYQNYVYASDLAWEITDAISSKVSPNQLRNYAFATGSQISKSDLVNALQTEITNKLTGSSTVSGNKLANVIINGQALVAGGYIQANLINADEIWCTSLAAIRGQIAGFTIQNDNLTNSDFNSYIYIKNPSASKFVKIGGNGTDIVNIQSYGPDNTGLYIVSNNPEGYGYNFAIKSYGRHIFGQRVGDSWNAPGALWGAYIKPKNNYVTYSWGDGIPYVSVSWVKDGSCRITHNLNHNEYIAIATPVYNGSLHGNAYMRIAERGLNSFLVDGTNADNGGITNQEFMVVIIGRNKWN